MRTRSAANYILFLLFWVAIIWILYYARSSLWYFGLGALFAYLGTNLVAKIDGYISKIGISKKFSRFVAILLYIGAIYIVFFALLFGFGSIIITQLGDLAGMVSASYILDELFSLLPESSNLLQQTIENGASGLSSLISTAAELIVALFLLPFFMIYLLSDPKSIRTGALRLLPATIKDDGRALYAILDKTVRRYLIGEAKLGFVVGSLTFVLYSFIGMPYALAFGVIAFALEFIPIYGPWMLYFISLIVAFTYGLEMVVAVSVSAAIIQFFEGNVLAPNIIGHQTRLRNWQIMLLVPIGGVLGGVIGMLLVIPIVVILLNVIYYIHLRLRKKSVSAEKAKELVESTSITFDDL